jgi:Mlc titration factor MtfA (ptsG expression regulator)
MIFDLRKKRRRKQWLAAELPADWDRWLRQNVWQYTFLDRQQQLRVREFVCIALHEKEWVGGGQFEISDEMCVTVAGQASLLTLGFGEPYYFDRLKTIILYAAPYHPHPATTDDLLIGRTNGLPVHAGTRLGESWQGGPVVLAWRAVLRDGRHARLRRSVVLHEFAHQMDSLDGSTDGAPPMTSYDFEKRWYQITDTEYRKLLDFTIGRQPTLIDPYGATSRAEFFAVVTECFFTAPHELARRHKKLFAVVEQLFGQDPRQWLPENADSRIRS